MLLKCTENFSRRDSMLAHKFEKSHCSCSVPVKNSQFKSNHGKTSRKPKFKEFYKRTGLCSSMIMVALRNVSIYVKQTQKAWKLNAIHNPGLDPLSEIKKKIAIKEITGETSKTGRRTVDYGIISMLTFLNSVNVPSICKKIPLILGNITETWPGKGAWHTMYPLSNGSEKIMWKLKQWQCNQHSLRFINQLQCMDSICIFIEKKKTKNISKSCEILNINIIY